MSDSLRTRLEGLLCDLAPGDLTSEQIEAESEILELFETLEECLPDDIVQAVEQLKTGEDDPVLLSLEDIGDPAPEKPWAPGSPMEYMVNEMIDEIADATVDRIEDRLGCAMRAD